MSGTRTIDLTVPRLGETMEEGAVRDWLKAVGDTFERGEAIVEIETDKTIAEVPALAAGRLVEIIAASGLTLDVGAVLGRIEVAASDAPQEPAPAAAPPPMPAATPADEVATAPATREAARGTGPIRATPVARRLARHAGIDIRTVTGTGRRGRVEGDDVRNAPSRSTEAPDTRIGMATATASSANLQRHGDIACTVDGPADGSPTLLLHGFAGNRTAWAATTHALARSGRRVLVPDLPGHGATTLEAGSVDDLSVQLDTLVGAVAGSEPCHLVAHSLGAAAALALAERIAVASITLIAPAGMGSSIDETFVRGMASPGSAGEVAHLLRRLGSRAAPMSPAAIEALTAELTKGRLKALADSLCGTVGQTLDLVPVIERLARSTPLRVITGHRDRIVAWQDACRLSPHVAVHHFPDAGHMPHWDFAADVADILLTER